MKKVSELLDAKLADEFRDLVMMREVMEGMSIKYVAACHGISPRTCRRRVQLIGSEMMRRVMEATQGDPDHPANARWTVEEFTADPRGCMHAMMMDTIRKIETRFPLLRETRSETNGITDTEKDNDD